MSVSVLSRSRWAHARTKVSAARSSASPRSLASQIEKRRMSAEYVRYSSSKVISCPPFEITVDLANRYKRLGRIQNVDLCSCSRTLFVCYRAGVTESEHSETVLAKRSGILGFCFEGSDYLILAALVLAGVGYYSLYYDCGFNIGDEGSVVLLGQRLLRGETPYADLVLGYGLLWYYPIVGLFAFTGVSFIVVRVYFLTLSLATGLLAFLTIRKHDGGRFLATLAALIVITVPGTIHKSYVPLLVVANMLFLPFCGRSAVAPKKREVFLGAVIVSVSFHVRPDLGLIVGLIMFAAIVLQTFLNSSSLSSSALGVAKLSPTIGVAVLVPSLPLLAAAAAGSFLEPFLQALSSPVVYLWHSTAAILERLAGLFSGGGVAGDMAHHAESLARKALAVERMSRVALQEVWSGGPARGFAIITYLPLISAAVLVILMCCSVVRRKLRSQSVLGREIEVLLLLGIAFSAFPQFFLYRPDLAHLAQFMPGLVVLAGVVVGRWLRNGSRSRRYPLRAAQTMGCSLIILQIAFYLPFGLTNPDAGSIALAFGRDERFSGRNGVNVEVTRDEKVLFETVARIAEEHSGEGDWMLCFPYCPGLNVLANRSTFVRMLYVDESLLVLDPTWQSRMVHRLQVSQPAVIIIRDVAMNRKHSSRFRIWAGDVMECIESEYYVVEVLGDYHFYARK